MSTPLPESADTIGEPSVWSDATVQVAAVVTCAMLGLILNFLTVLYTLRSPTILFVLVVVGVLNLYWKAKWGPVLVLAVVAALQLRSADHPVVITPNFEELHLASLALAGVVVGYIASHFQFLSCCERAKDRTGTIANDVRTETLPEVAAPYAWIVGLPLWPTLALVFLSWLYSQGGTQDQTELPDGVRIVLTTFWLLGGTTALFWLAYQQYTVRRQGVSSARLALNDTLYGELRTEMDHIAKRARKR